jgi:calcineurin-like phosphoesterase family protein
MITKIDEGRWIYTDPHFGHDRLRILARPQFNTLEEMHEALITAYNSTVEEKDVVVWLGDVGYRDAIKDILPRLKGYKILILGNHDNYAKSFYDEYFDEVHDKPLYFHKRVLLSHVPRMVSPGVLNVHGHTHNIKLKSNQHYNICGELVGWKPISTKKIMLMLNRIPKENIHFLQEWYAEIQTPNETYENRDLVLREDGTIDAEETLLAKYQKKVKG